MGNEQSQFAGIEIEEKAVEVSDFWSQHSATISNLENVTYLTVFIGELLVTGPLWKINIPLERNSKNLMIHRHPFILRYISSWQKSSKYYLAVEDVKPLTHVLASLNSLQICIGLHSILKAVCFLHETASVSHNNVCITSVYITKDGNWKLGGMEYLCRFTDLSSDFLNKSKSSRYNKAVEESEVKHIQNYPERKDLIDVYAFGVLVCDILKSKNDESVPALTQFYNLCKTDLQSSNISQRPKLTSLLDHEFFNHKFIAINSFLVELPLKSDEEKTEFFSTVIEQLKSFNEVTVAKQLGGLLLSRMVLLNKTANTDLLPFVLTPRIEDEDQSKGLFTHETFKKYLSPKIIEIFTVRDAQIRLLLLNHFHNFVETFTKEELQSHILPELLLGIKDTNDNLVSVTLRTLADLVPLLGAAIVIGGKRAKLFNDGRPIVHPGRKLTPSTKRPETIPEVNATPIVLETAILETDIPLNFVGVDLSERQMPDGEEGETSTEEVEQSADDDLDNWEDWDINENNHAGDIRSSVDIELNTDTNNSSNDSSDVTELENIPIEILANGNNERKDKKIVDISKLDIKNQLNNANHEDIDFFQDMEPVIQSANKFTVSDDVVNVNEELSSKLTLSETDVKEEGWGDEEW